MFWSTSGSDGKDKEDLSAMGPVSAFLLFAGGRLAPNSRVWESWGCPVVHLGWALFVAGLEVVGEFPKEAAEVGVAGLKFVNAYGLRRLCMFDTRAAEDVLWKARKDPEEAHVEALEITAPDLREYAAVLAEFAEKNPEDMAKTLEGIVESVRDRRILYRSPAIRYAMEELGLIGEDQEGWLKLPNVEDVKGWLGSVVSSVKSVIPIFGD